MPPAAAAVHLVDCAFSEKSPFSLSYTHSDLTWLIRDDFLSLLSKFPSLHPSADSFTFDDGTTRTLLNAAGTLPLSSSAAAPVHLTIWLHNSYPFCRPLVFLSPHCSLPLSHPYIHPSSGKTTTPYLQSWAYPHSNLVELVRDLVHVFSAWPPSSHQLPQYPSRDSRSPPPAPPSSAVVDLQYLYGGGGGGGGGGGALSAARREALECVTGSLVFDLADLKGETEKAMEKAAAVQRELEERAAVTACLMYELEREKQSLRKKVREMAEEADLVLNWLRANDTAMFPEDRIEEVFEGPDGEQQSSSSGAAAMEVIELWAEDSAADDAMAGLEKGLGGGVLTLEGYMRQVRSLAREQFYTRAKRRKHRALWM